MFFLDAPINGFLVLLYFLRLHVGYLFVLLFAIILCILEIMEKKHQFVDDERKIV